MASSFGLAGNTLRLESRASSSRQSSRLASAKLCSRDGRQEIPKVTPPGSAHVPPSSARPPARSGRRPLSGAEEKIDNIQTLLEQADSAHNGDLTESVFLDCVRPLITSISPAELETALTLYRINGDHIAWVPCFQRLQDVLLTSSIDPLPANSHLQPTLRVHLETPPLKENTTLQQPLELPTEQPSHRHELRESNPDDLNQSWEQADSGEEIDELAQSHVAFIMDGAELSPRQLLDSAVTRRRQLEGNGSAHSVTRTREGR